MTKYTMTKEDETFIEDDYHDMHNDSGGGSNKNSTMVSGTRNRYILSITAMKTEQYKCKGYYNDENLLRNCTCGKCAESDEDKARCEAEQDALAGEAEAQAQAEAEGEYQYQQEQDAQAEYEDRQGPEGY